MMDYITHGSTHTELFDDDLTKGQAWCLFLSHFLSMWNSRTYEYGEVGHRSPIQFSICSLTGQILFIQAAFPGSLLPSSIKYEPPWESAMLYVLTLPEAASRIPSASSSLHLPWAVGLTPALLDCDLSSLPSSRIALLSSRAAFYGSLSSTLQAYL